MFANLTTLPHFSVSSAMNFPKSADEPAVTVTPKSVSRALTLGSARAALISLLSLSTPSPHVPFGAAKPTHALDPYPDRKSLPAGPSGRIGDRIEVVTANGHSLP